MVTETAKAIGLEPTGLEKRIKRKGSFLRKIKSNYSPDSNDYEVKGILRYTYTADAQSLTNKALKSIDVFTQKGYDTCVIKNSWLNKNNPYKGINTSIKSPAGQVFELQYHTPESFALKNGKMHDLYERQRLIPDDTSPEFIRLRNEMFDLSGGLTIPKDIEKVKNK